ncbi:pyridoxal-dependent decarboxylase, exosortase A system-associated [Desulfonema ishimotonii]|uniref:Pyridoxal-dependent decarboxylase, exosortase A system-associated n=1 Tax=Desulfonema ishimotonii TaxID=45657 RepID=A0A401FUS2_9BACT|nr:pyridoxal-dependent decarboxylase, exosortase A system-associated [Desulfonema ishimotonii]GBC60710.1 pyridoxal-dependent decarboxylase, exosortase A system-associated [Desulfonema ishimotonii]
MTRDEFYRIADRETLVRKIAACGTPAYLFFTEMIGEQIRLLKACLGDRFSIHYAVKANPHPGILKYMAGQGVGADVASGGELRAALGSGISPGQIEFSGPGKTEDELKSAIARGIASVNAESVEELALLDRLAGQAGMRANVGIRVNPDFGKGASGIRMAGDTPFGIPEDRAGEALAFIKAHSERLCFTGLHVHTGSQISDEGAIIDNMQRILDLALSLERTGGLRMNKINFGGGWGIRYFPGQEKPDPDILAEELGYLFDEPEYAGLRERAQMILEPGRFLVAESGVYATKILYRKQIRVRDFAVVDGGMHQNYLLAGEWGRWFAGILNWISCRDRGLRRPHRSG